MDNNNIMELALGLSMATMFSRTMGQVMDASMRQQISDPIGEPHVFAIVNGQKCGPYTVKEMVAFLDSGQITPETYIWKAGMTDWMHIQTMMELKK